MYDGAITYILATVPNPSNASIGELTTSSELDEKLRATKRAARHQQDIDGWEMRRIGKYKYDCAVCSWNGSVSEIQFGAYRRSFFALSLCF